MSKDNNTEEEINAVTNDDGSIKVGNLTLKSIIKSFDGNMGILLELSFWDYFEDREVTITLSRGELNSYALEKEVTKKGGIMEYDAKAVVKGLNIAVNKWLKTRTAIYRYEHKKLGWIEVDGSCKYAFDKIYTSDSTLDSTYIGGYDIGPVGNIENIKNMVNKAIKGNVIMEAMMVLGAAGVAIGYSNSMWKTAVYNPIFHLMGNTSCGKSTSANLVSSFLSNPFSAKGCKLSYLSTTNAIVSRLSDANGVTFAIDELSVADAKNMSELIYTISNGFEKARCNRNGSVDDINQFSAMFISNGETSLLDKCNGNEGIRARVFEIEEDKYTRTADDSDVINQTVKSNYGILGPLVAKELMKNNDKWNESRLRYRNNIKNKVLEDGIKMNAIDRIVDYLSIIMVAGHIITRILDIDFDIEEILEYFYKWMILKNAEGSNIGKRAYDYLTNFAVMNPSRFKTRIGLTGQYEALDGKLGYSVTLQKPQKKSKLLVIPSDEADQLLNAVGITGKVAMRDLQMNHADLIKTKDANRPTYMINVNNRNINCYGLWVD